MRHRADESKGTAHHNLECLCRTQEDEQPTVESHVFGAVIVLTVVALPVLLSAW